MSSIFKFIRYLLKGTSAVTPNEGIKEESFQCEIRQGYFQGLADVFLHNELTVGHPECMSKDGEVCRYELTWRDSAFPILAVLSWLAGAAAIAMLIALWITPFAVVLNSLWLICPVFLFLGLGWAGQRVKSKALSRALRGIHMAREDMLNQGLVLTSPRRPIDFDGSTSTC